MQSKDLPTTSDNTDEWRWLDEILYEYYYQNSKALTQKSHGAKDAARARAKAAIIARFQAQEDIYNTRVSNFAVKVMELEEEHAADVLRARIEELKSLPNSAWGDGEIEGVTIRVAELEAELNHLTTGEKQP